MKTDFGAATRLADLGFAHLDVILEEAFGLPSQGPFPATRLPRTVLELATLTRLELSDVVRRLKEIRAMEQDIEVDPVDLAARLTAGEMPILLDVREPWEFETCHIKGSILLATANFPELLPRLIAAPEVVTICHHGVRSYSAALFLRGKGVKGARSLAGGVDVWSRTVDKTMARY